MCGESLPPDHFYCREHAAEVDDRLHAIAGRLPGLHADVQDVRELVTGIAEETWDYIAESDPSDPDWPPDVNVSLRVDTDQVEVDVDEEPGYVQVRLRLSLDELLDVAGQGLAQANREHFITACADVSGANATH